MGCPCSLSVLRETTEFLKSRSLRTHSVSMPSSMIHPVQGSLDTEVVPAPLLDL